MTFHDIFLQSQNQDCLGQIFSFLVCNDLANAARTCKVLQHNIFVVEKEEANVDLIWHSAEKALTKPWDRQLGFEAKGDWSHAREHCHLFAVASKAAKACELSDEVEENRIKVDGVLADLMHVRGFDAKGVAEKKTLGERAREQHVGGTQSGEESAAMEESEEDLQERWKRFCELPEPEETRDHLIFTRITSVATGDLISEGFCPWKQVQPWFAGLDFPLSREIPEMKQRVEIALHFQSLRESEELKNFVRAIAFDEEEGWTEEMFDSISTEGLGINVTALVVDMRNLSTRCLFQHDQTAEYKGLQSVGTRSGPLEAFQIFGFAAQPTWSSDSVQLGSSITQDSYKLAFSLRFHVLKMDDLSFVVVPTLDVNVQQDRS